MSTPAKDPRWHKDHSSFVEFHFEGEARLVNLHYLSSAAKVNGTLLDILGTYTVETRIVFNDHRMFCCLHHSSFIGDIPKKVPALPSASFSPTFPGTYLSYVGCLSFHMGCSSLVHWFITCPFFIRIPLCIIQLMGLEPSHIERSKTTW